MSRAPWGSAKCSQCCVWPGRVRTGSVCGSWVPVHLPGSPVCLWQGVRMLQRHICNSRCIRAPPRLHCTSSMGSGDAQAAATVPKAFLVQAPLCPGRRMLHSSMSQTNYPASGLAQPELVLCELAGARPAACLCPGSHQPQEPQQQPISLSPSCTQPPSLSPVAPWPRQPLGHAVAWQRRGGSMHCGCPLRLSWRRKQGFPGLEQVLPVSSS